VSGYTLVLAAALLPAGLLGDRYGRKRILLGLGAAAVIPLSLSVLTVLFTPDERPRAVGVWAAANFLALPLGPILGGWLAGARLTVASGFALLAVGLGTGATTGLTRGTGFLSLWTPLVGLGMALVFLPGRAAAAATPPPEPARVGG
jgi:MFS family permease